MKRFLCLAALLPAPAVAQDVPPIAEVELPDLSSASDPKSAKEGWKYFYFHKEGVSYEQAYADLSDCYRFMPSGGDMFGEPLPLYVDWEATPEGNARYRPNPYGIVGDVILSLLSGTMDRRRWQSRMRFCLEPRGYVRFPLDKDAWQALLDEHSAKGIAMQAKAAAEPRPNANEVTR